MCNTIDRFFKNATLAINWKYVDSIPEFAALKTCQQSPKWHGEGTAYQHTVKCVEAAYKKCVSYSGEEARIHILMVLFHDIGKSRTTEFKNGAWHAYGHEFAGEKITRRVLWDVDMTTRERICSAVRHHMEPLRIADSKRDLMKNLITLSYEKFFSWESVLFVKECDTEGSVPEDPNEKEISLKKLKFLRDIISRYGISNSDGLSYENSDNDMFYETYVQGKKIDWLGREKPNHKLIFMVGLPGAGKNTLIENLQKAGSEFVVISRDDIRYELGYCNEGDKVVLSRDKEEAVSEEFNRRLVNAVHENKDIVINNINLKKVYRDSIVEMVKSNQSGENRYDVLYFYVEAADLETLTNRRPGIPIETFKTMVENLDFPRPNEYDCLKIFKQNR